MSEIDSSVSGIDTSKEPKGKKNVKAKKKESILKSRTLRNVWWAVVVVVLCMSLGYIIWKGPSKFGRSDADTSVDEVATTGLPTRPPPTKIACETPGCNKYAQDMLAHMNKDQEACYDPHSLACGTYVHSDEIVTEKMKKMLEDNSTQYEGPMKYAKILFDLCEAGKTDASGIKDSEDIINSDYSKTTSRGYQRYLAKAGMTNFGHFKLDLERLSDPNDVHPRTVVVIQDHSGYDSSDSFGYKYVSRLIRSQFAAFDSVENRAKPNDKLIPMSEVYPKIPTKKQASLINILKGWFPDTTSEDDILANLWTYDYEYWKTEIVVPPETSDEYDIVVFYWSFSLLAMEQSLHDAIYTPKDCYKMVVETIPQAFAQYTGKDEDREKIEKINKLADKYKKKSVEVLKKAVMDDESRQKLVNRVEHFKVVVGYPDDWKDGLDLGFFRQDFMKDINHAHPEVKRWQVLQHFKYLADPQDHYPAFYGFYASKTYYNTKDNILHLHTDLLDDPFFNNTYPSFVNYGGFGQLIGKGVSDAIAQLYREEGSTGVNKEAKDAYKTTSKCFAGQGLDDKDKAASGKTAVDETITDNIGTFVSYQLMKEEEKKAEEDGKEHVLKGFEKFNNAQWFFLVAAKRICVSPLEGLSTKTSAANDLKTIGKDRVKSLMSNLPQFVNNFNCSKFTPMRPTQQCHFY